MGQGGMVCGYVSKLLGTSSYDFILSHSEKKRGCEHTGCFIVEKKITLAESQ